METIRRRLLRQDVILTVIPSQKDKALRGIFSLAPMRTMLLIFLGSLTLLWPALINGGPFWFPDTSNYVRAADSAVVYATGHESEWSDRLVVVPNASPAFGSLGNAAPVAAEELQPTRPIYAGRSIYYGFLIYLPMILLGGWGAILVQALVVAGVIFYVGRILGRELQVAPPQRLLWAGGALALATPLPYYTSMLMPDVYSGLLVLTLGLTITFFDRLTFRERWILVLASAVFTTFHTTHLLIAASMAAVALLIAVVGRSQMRPILTAVPVILLGAASMALFNFAVKMTLEEKPFSPPFLSARLTAAGPGTEYLQRNCGTEAEQFLLCQYRHRFPLHSDSFLWSEDPEHGLFQLLSREEQLRIAAEDKSFFVATLMDDPFGFLRTAASSSLEQLFSFDLINFNYPERRTEALFDKYPRDVAHAIANTRAANRDMPVAASVWLSLASTLAGLILIIVVAVRVRRRNNSDLPRMLWHFLALVLLAVLANAAICGALSGPHARYQMRLIWIIPFVASICMIGSYRSRPLSTAAKRKIGPETAR